jgi:hypothetical protein
MVTCRECLITEQHPESGVVQAAAQALELAIDASGSVHSAVVVIASVGSGQAHVVFLCRLLVVSCPQVAPPRPLRVAVHVRSVLSSLDGVICTRKHERVHSNPANVGSIAKPGRDSGVDVAGAVAVATLPRGWRRKS